MAEIPTTFQLPFVLSSRKRVLHWRGQSTSCTAFPLPQTLERLAKTLYWPQAKAL